MDAPPTYELSRQAEQTLVLSLQGAWTIAHPRPDLTAILSAIVPDLHRLVVTVQLSGWDSMLLVTLTRILDHCRQLGVAVDLSGLPAGANRMLALVRPPDHRPEAKRPLSLVERIGLFSLEAMRHGGQLARFTGNIILGLGSLLGGRAYFQTGDFLSFLQSCSVGSLPIVSLISLLVGVILAFVGAVQLQMFGAQIYVANLVALAMILEMGAMMTGVIMAGRIGAAYAAQLGTMQVNEEIDALRTLGIDPLVFLVLPRMLALVCMLPLLCVYADLLGICGGTLIGVGMLDLSLSEYLLQTRKAIMLHHFVQGLIKATAFGVLIGFAGCYHGMRCGRSAAAVGEATTAAVVMSIVLIVVSDSILTIIFNHLHWTF